MEAGDIQELRDIVREELEVARQPDTAAIRDAVRIAVKETFMTLGMDASEPLELQQDMHFLRDLRGERESMRSKGRLTVIGMLCAAAGAVLWTGFKAAVLG